MIRDVLRGALGFAAVSTAAFAVWAFGPLKGPAMYAAITAVFLVLTGVVLHPLAGSPGRFVKAFVPAFLAYAALWSLVWFLARFPGRDWIGTAAGCAAFTLLLGAVLGGLRAWPRVFAVVLAAHAAGYWLGGVVCYGVGHNRPGMLAWGLFYGLGFGAGIGYAFHAFRTLTPPAPSPRARP